MIVCPTDPVTCLAATQQVQVITDNGEKFEEVVTSQNFSSDIETLCRKYNVRKVGIHSDAYFNQLKNNITNLYSEIEVIKI